MFDSPWERPRGGPNRYGDLNPEPIYTAMGRAISNWEGVEAATLVLMKGMTSDTAKIEMFERTFKVRDRARQILDTAITALISPCESVASARFQQHIRAAMEQYIGWSERRNDVAHGYVTPMWSQHPSFESIVQSFSLCPSHTNPAKWSHGEPYYNLNAEEIEAFATSFKNLDDRLEALAKQANKMTKA